MNETSLHLEHRLWTDQDSTCAGRPAVGAVMESFFSTLKTELADRFPSFSEAKMELFDYIEPFYNQRRRHSTLGQISPAAFDRPAVA